jgi:histidine ammonia-lyase
MTGRIRVDSPEDLSADAVRAVADGARLELSTDLLAGLARDRADLLAALADAGRVYGVTTGMGLQAQVAVDPAAQATYQDDLMLARAVGAEPWLDQRTVRAVLAVRLRTLLGSEVGVSGELVAALAAVLDTDLRPAVPSRGNGAAGEIIPLAHLGGLLIGTGQVVAPDGWLLDAGEALAAAGLQPHRFGPKEGVAFLQGVPVATARALLLGTEVRLLAAQQLAVAAGSIVFVRAPRDPYDAALDREDDVLAHVHARLRALVGNEDAPQMLQAPVSFRVVGPALAHLLRCLGRLESAARRALCGVTTSPAFVGGRFLGTAGFDGFELAAELDAVRLAALRLAELGTARLHRLLDPRVTGVAPQLVGRPGSAGLVTLHKRAVGLLHEVRRTSAPASAGTVETSLGQEDAQSFGLEAADALAGVLEVLRDVTACELLAVHRAQLLDPARPQGTKSLQMVLHKGSDGLPTDVDDRPFGREVTALRGLLGVGWAHDVLT